MVNLHRTPEQWQQIFEQYSASGLAIVAFCKQQKLNTSSFYAWRKRLSSSDEHSAIITPLTTPPKNNQGDWLNIVPEQIPPASLPPKHWDIELALPNGIILRMNNS